MNFSDLGLGDGVLKAVEDAGYTTPTPIQEQAIPVILMGRDILGCAQTGTGKTASFTLPMIDILHNGRAKARMPRSLILEPTRELAAQVADNFDTYGKYHKLTKALLIGGSSMNDQMKVIDRGPDVLIATPGRLLDLFERGRLLMTDVKTLVIDEADRMLDMGFIPDVEKIVSLISPMRQTLFFSATLPPEIRRLADKFLMNPKEITVAALSSSDETITQGLVIVPHDDGRRPGGGHKEKRAAMRKLIDREDVKDAIIFCNRKRDVGIVYRSMLKHGYSAGQLHGDMAQPARMEMLERFKGGKFTFMVCSDVAARGLDIPALSHVFNFDVPTHAEDYVHRIGRTGRAGKEGHAYTIAVPEDGKYLDAIQKLIGKDIPLLKLDGVETAKAKSSSEDGEGRGRSRDRNRGRGRGRDQNRDNSRDDKAAQDRKPEVTPEERNAKETPREDKRPQENSRERPRRNDKRPERDSRKSHARNSQADIRASSDGDGTKFGDSEHVPAFMQRPAKPKKK